MENRKSVDFRVADDTFVFQIMKLEKRLATNEVRRQNI